MTSSYSALHIPGFANALCGMRAGDLPVPAPMRHQRRSSPVPGLGVRVVGEVTPEPAKKVRAADGIVRDEIAKAGLDGEVWQAFAVLADIRSVGVMGDERTYAHQIVVRAVTSEDAMTCSK